MEIENFLSELTELSKKHGMYIRARHEDDEWYSPLLIDSKVGINANIVADSLYWNEREHSYTAYLSKNEIFKEQR